MAIKRLSCCGIENVIQRFLGLCTLGPIAWYLVPSKFGRIIFALVATVICSDEYLRLVFSDLCASAALVWRIVFTAAAAGILIGGYWGPRCLYLSFLVTNLTFCMLCPLVLHLPKEKTEAAAASSKVPSQGGRPQRGTGGGEGGLASGSDRRLPNLTEFFSAMFSFIWCPLTFGHGYDLPVAILIHPVLVTIIGENGALVAGSVIGGRKLIPRVSPRKTVAGCVGQLLTTIVASILYLHWTSAEKDLPRSWGFGHSALAGVVVAVCATLGDLFESVVKRTYHTKDMGTLLPGSGGLLDRLDGILFALPAFSMYYWTVLALDPQLPST